MKRFQAEEKTTQMTEEERETIEALLHYPSLEKVFGAGETYNSDETKRKMRSSIVELERIVRSGAQGEADRAAKIIAAYETTIGFLNELEERRKNQSK